MTLTQPTRTHNQLLCGIVQFVIEMLFDPCYDVPRIKLFGKKLEPKIGVWEKGIASMTSKMAKTVTDVCNELPFVNWDRFIDSNGNVMLFGWIDREEDSYKDFVCIEVSSRGYLSFTTSSAKYSETISNIYVSHGRLLPGTHKPCQRIENNDQLADIRNVVKIRDR